MRTGASQVQEYQSTAAAVASASAFFLNPDLHAATFWDYVKALSHPNAHELLMLAPVPVMPCRLHMPADIA